MPNAVDISLEDMLGRCARLEAGQRVLIMATTAGLRGGPNLVDRETVAYLEDEVKRRGAYPTVLWEDPPNELHAWKVPQALKAALSQTDLFISNVFDLPFEELFELREVVVKNRVTMIRNMATTQRLLSSRWAQTPYELVSEIRYRTSSFFEPGLSWSLSHANGTELEGLVGKPIGAFKQYNERRSESRHRPYPEGVFTPVSLIGTEGTLSFKGSNPWWGRYIGVPPRFSENVRVTVENNRICDIRGGEEAMALKRFFAQMTERLGEGVLELGALHGGVHPCARVTPEECPDFTYREFIEHHHFTSLHLHLGVTPEGSSYPYMLHVTAELQGATLKAGGETVSRAGYLTALDHPEVKAVAARYPGRPGLPERPSTETGA